ncbi:MAG: phosphatidylserine synthase [Ruminococcaceae bacterium]|nr:phosphatidylserine synthase [Oscillospiraceae bacterium]
MLGFYDYTVILTYISLISAGSGILISLADRAHPYWGIFFLMLCGLLDAFDGRVARTKKNRTEMEKSFGIQIDSLSDLVAFGVLPACIGAALIRTSPYLCSLMRDNDSKLANILVTTLLFAILILYVLAALIRLAYFNVTEEERQRKESTSRKYFMGLPVTSAALIFPTVMLVNYITKVDISIIYFPVTLITGLMFVLKFRMPKPGLKGILIMIAIGVLEAAALLLFILYHIKRMG